MTLATTAPSTSPTRKSSGCTLSLRAMSLRASFHGRVSRQRSQSATTAASSFAWNARMRIAYYSAFSRRSDEAHRLFARSTVLRNRGGGAGLSVEADQADRALPRRLDARHRRTNARAEAERGLGPAGGGGEQDRRRRQHRHGGSGEVGARRVHAGDRHQRPGGGEQGALQEPALRPGEGPRADLASRRGRADARRASL